jgi:PAS domain S-box-containing protein
MKLQWAGKAIQVLACTSVTAPVRAQTPEAQTVMPHFTQTLPFYLGTGLLVLVALATMIRFRVRRSERRAEQLAREVEQRTRALEEEFAERRKTEAALHESEERQRAVMLLMPVVMYAASTPSEIDAEWISENVERITGFPPAQFTGVPRFWVSRIHPEDAHHLQWLMEQVRDGKTASCEYRWLCADGHYRWFLDTVVAARSTGNGLHEYSGILLDIHERRVAEDRLRSSLREKEVLLKEIHHRVKNNLTVISSLLNLQSGASSDRKVIDVLRDAAHRVASMASIHEQLYRSNNLAAIDFREYAERLVRQLERTFRVPGIEIDLRADEAFLEINEAIPCGLIINELVTNALKYAFRDRSSGRIVVSMEVGEDGLHTLEVRDDGVGIEAGIDPEQATTLGLRLVSLLAEQLGGKARIIRNHGTHCTIAFRPPSKP